MFVARSNSERLRDSFADLLRTQALEASQLAGLAGDDPDLREAVGQMLERVQRTARALHLDQVEQVAATAARSMQAGAGGDALLPLLEACRAIDPTAAALRCIIVVGAPAGGEPEPLVRRVPTVTAAQEVVFEEAALAVVLPLDALVAGAGAGFGDVPRYAWGHADDLACRLTAARHGALAYFAAPLDLRIVAARVRTRALLSREPDRLLLVGASDSVTSAWVRAFADLPVELTLLRSRDHLLATLEDVDPAVVVLADSRAAELAVVLRGHPEWWDLPRVVVTDDPPEGLIELVLPASLSLDRLRAQGRALLERARHDRELRAQDRATGVLPAVALLRAADREAAIARRGRLPLAIARVDIDEPSALRRVHGSAGIGLALRLLARALQEGLRGTDLVGRIGEHGFGALLPSTTAVAMRARFDEVEQRFRVLAEGDSRLEGVTVTAGLSDLGEGYEGVFLRADRDRLQARRGA